MFCQIDSMSNVVSQTKQSKGVVSPINRYLTLSSGFHLLNEHFSFELRHGFLGLSVVCIAYGNLQAC